LKIILINPPICLKDVYGRFEKLASFQPPMGITSLAGYMLQYGHKIEIIDANAPCDRGNDLNIEDIVKELKKYPPDLVGLYTISYNYPVIEKLSRAIREALPKLKIIAGGPHATFMAKETLTETPIDFCALGEAEETLHELVQHLEDGSSDLSSIQGLAYKTAEGEVVVNSERVRVKDLDELPFPAIHLLPSLERYKPYLLHHKRTPLMTVATSRGCPYKCVFCETPSGKIVRAHSAEYVVDYMDFLSKQYGVREITFLDDTFTLNEKRVHKICDLIHKKNIDITWYATAHANVRDMDMFKAMKKAGCWVVAVGIESGNQKVLDTLQKGTTKENMRATCQGVLDAKLKLKTFFVLGNPGDTVETMNETIDFARELKGHFPVFSLMTPFPGAPLWENAEEYGTFDRSSFDKLTIATEDPVFIPFGLTKELLLNKQKEAFRKAYFTPSMAFRHLAGLDSIEDGIKLFKAFIAYMNIQFTHINVQKKLNAQIESS
jgi:anaerobic magnesium-protoporphyrin IX monomethyl ester cyclase